MLELPPLSLYLHIPWCVRKCPYCDFNSHQTSGDFPEAEYVTALQSDLQFESSIRDSNDKRPLHSIFIGGGTPSLFSGKSIASILDSAEKLYGFSNNIEITLEANPGTAEAQRFKDYLSGGVNRLSIGVQSFQDDKLSALGRIHSADEARSAIALCQKAGFENFNLDLMYGLPDQTVEDAIDDLNLAIQLSPTHISWYQLTIEPNTNFYSKPPRLPEDSESWAMVEAGLDILDNTGFKRYEVSAYARNNHEAKHNLNYWQYGDYLGVGAGAHGKLTIPGKHSVIRNRKKMQPAHYIEADINREAERYEVSEQERPFEYLMNALRLREGFDKKEFETRTGVTFSNIVKQVEYLSAQDLLSIEGERVKATDHGYRVLNSLLQEFLDID